MESSVNRAPAVSGVGLVTALGQSSDETWNALLAGRAIADHARAAGFSGDERAIDMACRAASEALGEAGWNKSLRTQVDSGIFVGTSKGAIESWLRRDGDAGNFDLFTGLSRIDVELARRLGFEDGPRMTLSSACSSGLHALVRAVMGIASGEIRRALVVGVEASVHPLFIASFKRLGVLAPEGHGCRPMDRDRRGFLVSEAAAAVCLQAGEELAGRPSIRIDRWAIGGDGTHLTGGDPEGKALRKLLARVMLPRCDLVHAHATGTIVNDPVELAAISDAGLTPWIYSHKGALGHSLGAAGMVSVAINCLIHRHRRIPGNVRTRWPLDMGGLRFSDKVVESPIRRSVVCAAGFGGPLAVVGLESGEEP